MNLTVRFIDAPAMPGGKALALCDADGNMLPMQQHTEFENGVHDGATITVTFRVDGEQVRIID